MSHRDQHCRKTSDATRQELSQAIRWLLAGLSLGTIVFRKDCRWSPRGLIACALLWAWSREEALTERYEEALNAASGMDDCRTPSTSSYQAFMKLLVRWTRSLANRLIGHLRMRMEQSFPAAWRIAGFIVLAADGTKCELPRTRSNQGWYTTRQARKKSRTARGQRRKPSRAARDRRAREKKADSPQLMLTALFHLGLKLPWDWRMGASDASERDHLRAMLADLPENTLITADRGFIGYEFWRALLDRQVGFVIRVGGNVRLLTRLGRCREANGIVYLWPSRAVQSGQPPLMLRLVVVHDGRRPWYLVTNVLDRRRLSDRDVAMIYRQRWGIELFFRYFKQTYHRGKLRSHKADHAACELQWSLLGVWTMMLYAKVQLAEGGLEPGCLSVAGMLKAFGRALRAVGAGYRWSTPYRTRCKARICAATNAVAITLARNTNRPQNRRKSSLPAKPNGYLPNGLPNTR